MHALLVHVYDNHKGLNISILMNLGGIWCKNQDILTLIRACMPGYGARGRASLLGAFLIEDATFRLLGYS